jgi:hypothetical protein
MANQHEGSLEHKIKEKFDCSAVKFFEICADEGLTYLETAKKVGGFTNGTIRKWAKRLGIELMPDQPIKVESAEYQEKFYANDINIHNFLSRKWATN